MAEIRNWQAAAAIIVINHFKRKQKKRRWWVRPWLVRRHAMGTYKNLLQEIFVIDFVILYHILYEARNFCNFVSDLCNRGKVHSIYFPSIQPHLSAAEFSQQSAAPEFST